MRDKEHRKIAFFSTRDQPKVNRIQGSIDGWDKCLYRMRSQVDAPGTGYVSTE